LHIRTDWLAFFFSIQMITTIGGQVPVNMVEACFYLVVLFVTMTVGPHGARVRPARHRLPVCAARRPLAARPQPCAKTALPAASVHL
jgi:hypothetical protein